MINRRGFFQAIFGYLAAGVAAAADMPNRYFAFEGDSISSMKGTYTQLYEQQSTPRIHAWMFAASGNKLIDLVNRSKTVDASIRNYQNDVPVLSVLLGNDFDAPAYSDYGGERATFLSMLADYLDARRAVGWKVLLMTTLPRSGSEYNRERNFCNEVIRKWVGTHCDYLCDFGADPIMGQDRAAWNRSLYRDGIHPTESGFIHLAKLYTSAADKITAGQKREG